MADASTALLANLQSAHQKIRLLQAEVTDYKQKYYALRRDLFGRKSEKISVSDAQNHLFNEAERLVAEARKKTKRTKGKGHTRGKKRRRDSIPPHIERKEIRHDIADKACTDCGKELKHIGDDITERLNIIPEQIYAEKHIYPKYRCSNKKCLRVSKDQAPEIKSAPRLHFLKAAIVSASLLARIIIRKYLDALPLYRQESIFRRHDIEISRQSLANWVVQGYKQLEEMKILFREELVMSKCILIDESTFQVLNEDRADAKNKKYYIWHMRASPPSGEIAYYEYQPSRNSEFLQGYFKDYGGAILSDGLKTYDTLTAKLKLGHGGCWAHSRRYFFKALDQDPENPDLKTILDLIGSLFKLEEIKDEQRHLDALKFRQRLISPVINTIKSFLKEKEAEYPQSTLMGKGISYTQAQWPKLTYFLKNKHLPIHNNDTENGIRPFVIGRKNWLFAVSIMGADASALWYSLIQTAIANGLNPEKYLVYLFEMWPLAKTTEEKRALMPNRVLQTKVDSFYEGYGQR